MKTFSLIILLAILLQPTTFDSISFEDQISKILNHRQVKRYFKDTDLIVLVKNDICNEETLDVSEIKSKKEIRLYDKMEAFMRGIPYTIEVENLEKVNNKKVRFQIEMKDSEKLIFEFHGKRIKLTDH